MELENNRDSKTSLLAINKLYGNDPKLQNVFMEHQDEVIIKQEKDEDEYENFKVQEVVKEEKIESNDIIQKQIDIDVLVKKELLVEDVSAEVKDPMEASEIFCYQCNLEFQSDIDLQKHFESNHL